MLATTVALTLASAQRPMVVAFTARFYKPGRQKSYHQLYLSDAWGNRELIAASPGADMFDVAWVSRDELAWVEYDRAGSGSRLCYMRLGGRRQVLLKRATSIVPLERSVDQEPLAAFESDGKYVVTTGGKIKAYSKTAQQFSHLKTCPDESSDDGFSIDGVGSYGLVVNTSRSESVGYLVQATGKQPLPDAWKLGSNDTGFASAYLDNGNRRVLVRSYEGNSARGGRNDLLCFDPQTGHGAFVARDALDIDISSKRQEVAWQSCRDLAPLPQGGNVWTSSIWLSTRIGGWRRKIVGALAYCSGVSVRPGAKFGG